MRILNRSAWFMNRWWIPFGLLLLSFSQAGIADEAPKWERYVAQVNQYSISKDDAIQLRFYEAMVDAETINQNWQHALNITPQVEGQVEFLSPYELRFTPNHPLTSGQEYQVQLDATAFTSLPNALGAYQFKVSVIPMDYSVHIEPIDISSAGVRIRGVVSTSDRVEDQAIESLLNLKSVNESVTLQWDHGSQGRQHRFRSNLIPQPTQASTATLSWNAQVIGIEETGERLVTIPAKNQFSVLEVKQAQGNSKEVVVQFTGALKPNQNLNGLVTLDGSRVRTSIHQNQLKIYLDKTLSGNKTLKLHPGIKSKKGRSLEAVFQHVLSFGAEKPEVRFIGEGVILPNGDRLEVPIETMNVSSVQIAALQVFDNRMGQFLQQNRLQDSSGMRRVGRYLWRKTLELPNAKTDRWERYSLDVTDLVKSNPGGLFQLTLSINRGNYLLECEKNAQAKPILKEFPLVNENGSGDEMVASESSYWDGIENAYNGSDSLKWNKRHDACNDAYYRYQDAATATRNIIASNIGLIAKKGTGNRFLVVTTDLQTGKPKPNTYVEFRDFQDQLIARRKTDAQGTLFETLSRRPYYLLAFANQEGRGYLRVDRHTALPISHFDVGGSTAEQGVKAVIYGERDVWRPGDQMHLNFVVHDPNQQVPDQHPATLLLIGPKGQVHQKVTQSKPLNGFYRFDVQTTENAPTGRWVAKVLLGGRTFEKRLRVESIQPNRLAISTEPKTTPWLLNGKDNKVGLNLSSHWLHGATAADLNADVQMRFNAAKTQFKGWPEYVFDDPTRHLNTYLQEVWKGKLDAAGKISADIPLSLPAKAPGKITAHVVTRVFEPGGAFSIQRNAYPLYPYQRYVGVKLPKGDNKRNMLLTDETHQVAIQAVDVDGKPTQVAEVEVNLYKLNWKWWWDKSSSSVTQSFSAEYAEALDQKIIALTEGKGTYDFSIQYPDWGRYLVRVCDTQKGGHCTGQVMYVDWPGWAGRAQEMGDAAAVLTLALDKAKYSVGETAQLRLPEGVSGRALLTLEKGQDILEHRWVELEADEPAIIPINIQSGMAPNLYAAITLIQSHAERDNERPIRLQGIVPLMVEDPATLLEPVVEVEEEWKPKTQVQVKVKEKQAKPMTYTLAVVDEGLLGITGFKTPNLHQDFYRREALGVMTWDLFSQVIGAYGAELDRLLAIGGSDASSKKGKNPRERRFPPVVKFLGPFELNAGATAEHTIEIPQYIGAVRVMVVAGQAGAYGSEQKEVKVREPLSTLVTLPRVLGPSEEVQVPVSVFAFDPKLTNANVSLEFGPGLSLVGDKNQVVDFTSGKEQLARFMIKVSDEVRSTYVRTRIKGGEHQSESETFIQVRAPSAPRTIKTKERLEPGESKTLSFARFGLSGTEQVELSLSTFPSFGLTHRLNSLIRYPYGCLEQTVSGAIPQLYLSKLIALTPKQAEQTEDNVHAALDRLRNFMHADGQFRYWPGTDTRHQWANVYAGYFLVEAKRAGYQVPSSIYNTWTQAARKLAKGWTRGNADESLTQAFRLWVLAKAEMPEVAAMNRLRSSKTLDTRGHWLLAAAYAQLGLKHAAQDLLDQSAPVVHNYQEPGVTFGSDLRDEALYYIALNALEDDSSAIKVSETLADKLNSSNWYSTHSLGFALSALAQSIPSVSQTKTGIKVDSVWENLPESQQTLIFKRSMMQWAFEDKGKDQLSLTNNSDLPVYAELNFTAAPKPSEETLNNSLLAINVQYLDAKGQPINVSQLTQGTTLGVVATVHNKSGRAIKNIALNQPFPSGWEIMPVGNTEQGQLTYQDIRDDRVYSFFDLNKGESRTFRLKVTATYAGRFYAPGSVVEAMYDGTLKSRLPGQWVDVKAR